MILAYFLALAGGCIGILSKLVNVQVAQRLGTENGTLINYLIASALALVLALCTGATALFSPAVLGSVPPVYYLGGVFGLLSLLLTVVSIPKVPVISSTVLMLAGQLGTGLLIDWLLLGKFSLPRTAGILLVAAGLVLDKFLARPDGTETEGQPDTEQAEVTAVER